VTLLIRVTKKCVKVVIVTQIDSKVFGDFHLKQYYNINVNRTII